MSRAALCLAAILLAGCAGDPPMPPAAAPSFCEVAGAIYWDDADQLDATPAPVLRRIMAHNKAGEALCGW